MNNKIEWEVLLPLIGIKLLGSEINFGPFSIRRSNVATLNSQHGLSVKDSMWSPLALAVRIVGDEMPPKNLCDWCPKRSEPYTRPLEVNGEILNVTSPPRKACICLKIRAKPDRTDSVAIALPLLEDALSLIRLYIHISSRGHYPAFSAISLQRLPHYSAVVALSDNGIKYSEDVIPTTRKYDVPINQTEVNAWIEGLGFEDLAMVIYRSHIGESVTEIEEVLGASFIQFGSMLEEANLRDCFLRGATALEAIANAAPGKTLISLKFREIGATLSTIASHGHLVSLSTYQVGTDMKAAWTADRDRLKLIYKHRCHISHGSRRLNESDEDELYSHQKFFMKIAFGALLLFVGSPRSKQHFYEKLLIVQKMLST